MAKYIKPDRSSWTHDQLEHELENSMKLYRTAMKQYMDDQSTITAQEDIIKRLKEDAERLVESVIAEFRGKDRVPHFECQLCENSFSESLETVTHDADCPITLHTQLMNELGEK